MFLVDLFFLSSVALNLLDTSHCSLSQYGTYRILYKKKNHNCHTRNGHDTAKSRIVDKVLVGLGLEFPWHCCVIFPPDARTFINCCSSPGPHWILSKQLCNWRSSLLRYQESTNDPYISKLTTMQTTNFQF